MQSNIGKVNGLGILRDFGGDLCCLYCSDKWEFGRKTYFRRNWKHYRKTKYRFPKPSAKAFFVGVNSSDAVAVDEKP